MAKAIPTEHEVTDFKQKQGELHDQIQGFEQEKEIALDKNNPTIYKEAERKIDATQEQFDKNTEEWDKKYGNEVESDSEKEQEQSQEQSQEQGEEEELEK